MSATLRHTAVTLTSANNLMMLDGTTDGLEARWAELVMPVIDDEESTVRPRDPQEHSPAGDDVKFSYPPLDMRLSDNQKDMILNYGTKYPELVGDIIVSSAFSNRDVAKLEQMMNVRRGTIFAWRRQDCMSDNEVHLSDRKPA